MKVIVEINEEPKVGSILVFDGKEYKPVSKEVFLNQVSILSNKVKDLEKEVKKIKVGMAYDRGEITKEEYDNELGNNLPNN